MGNHLAKDPEVLSKRLRQELDKEGFDSMAEFEYTLQRTQQDLEDLEHKGRSTSARGQQLGALQRRLEEILRIREEVLQQSSSLETLLVGALKEEGIGHGHEVEKELQRTCSDLTKLKAENKQCTSEGKELHSKLHRLESILQARDKMDKIFEDGLDIRQTPSMRRISIGPHSAAPEPPIPDESFTETELNGCVHRFHSVLHDMPDCTEKFLALLVLHFQILSNPHHTSAHVQFSADEVQEHIHLLEQWIRDEELEDSVVVEAMVQIKQLLESRPRTTGGEGAVDAVNAPSWAGTEVELEQDDQEIAEQLRHELVELLWHIQPLDLGKLLILITNAEEAVQVLRDREVVLLLGLTDSGKTTTVQYLSGAAMKHVVSAVNGADHIYAVNSPQDGGVWGSIKAVKCPRLVSMDDLSEIPCDENMYVTVCDTPGFGGFGNAEVCIANAHTIVMATQLVKSVRPLVLLSWTDIRDQSDDLSKVLRILVRLFQNIPEQLGSLTYGFTKTPRHHEEHIHTILQNKLETLSRCERNMPELVALLQDMVDKTETNPLVINPLDSLSRHATLERLLQTTPIADPPMAFRTSVTQAHLQQLENQLRKSVASIHHALRRGHMGLVRYKMNQLGALSQRMSICCIQKAHHTCIHSIRSHADALVDDILSRLRQSLEDSDSGCSDNLDACQESLSTLAQLTSLPLHGIDELDEFTNTSKLKVCQTQEELLHRLKTSHEAVGIWLHRFSEASSDGDQPTPSSPLKRPRSPLPPAGSPVAPVSPTGADGADNIASMCSKLRQSARQIQRMQLVVQALGPVVGQPMQEELGLMHEQGLDDLVGLHATLKEVAFNLLQKLRPTQSVGVFAVLKVIAEAAKEHGFAQHLAQSFEDDVRNFHRIFVRMIDEAVEVLGRSVPAMLKQAPSPAAHIDDQLRQVQTVSRDFNDGLPRVWQQIAGDVYQEQQQRLQRAFTAFFDDAVAAFSALLSSGGEREPPMAEVLKLLDRTWAFSHLSLSGPRGVAAVQDMMAELQETVASWTYSALQHLHRLQYASALRDTDYDDLFRSVRALTHCHEALGATDWVVCGQGLERVRSEMEKALNGVRTDVESLLQKGPNQIPVAVDAVTNAFLFVGACETAPSVAELCKGALLGLQECVSRCSRARDAATDSLLSDMQALLGSLFEQKMASEAPVWGTHAAISSEEIVCAVDWMRFQCAFAAFANSASQQDSESMRACAALSDGAGESFARRVRTLQALHTTLREGINGATMYQLQGAVRCARDWKPLDAFMSETSRFDALCSDAEATILQQNISLLADMRLDLHMMRYREFMERHALVDHSLSAVQHGVAQLIRELASGVQALAGDVESTLSSLDIRRCAANHVQDVVQKIGQLSAAEKHIMDLLPADVKRDVKPQLMMQQLQKVMAVSLDAFNIQDPRSFRSTDRALQDFEEKADCLAQLSPDVAEDSMEALVQQIACHRRTLQQTIEAACAPFDQQPSTSDVDLDTTEAVRQWCCYFGKWTDNPPKDLYDALETARETDGGVFPDAKARLQCSLSQSLDQALTVLETLSDFQLCNALSDAVGDALAYCPTKLVQQFHLRVKAARELITCKHEMVQREIKDKAEAGQLIALVDQLVDRGVASQYPHMELTRNEIRKLIFAQAAQLTTAIQGGDTVQVLRSLPDFWSQWQHYLEALQLPYKDLGPWQWLVEDPECAQRCQEVRELLVNAVLQSLRSLTEDQRQNPPKFLEQLGTEFPLLVALLETQAKDKGKLLLQDIIPDLVPMACAILDSLLTDVARLHTEFQEHMDRPVDLTALKPVLDMCQRLQPLRGHLDAYAESCVGQSLHPAMKAALAGAQSYPAMMDALQQVVARLKGDVIQPVMQKGDALDRNEFFRHLGKAYQGVQLAAQLGNHLRGSGMDPTALCNEVDTHIVGELRGATNVLLDRARHIPGADDLYAELNLGIENLLAFQEHFGEPQLAKEAATCSDSVAGHILSQTRQICASAWTQRSDRGVLVDSLVEMKRISVGIAACRQAVNKMIDVLLKDIRAMNPVGGSKEIAMLSVHLNDVRQSEKRAAAQMLIADHAAFEGYSLALRNEKTLKFKVGDVLQALRGDRLSKRTLQDQYTRFDAEYWGLVQGGLMNTASSDGIVAAAHALARGPLTADAVRQMAAHVCAFWTLSHSKHYTEAQALGTAGGGGSAPTADGNLTNYLLQPHSAQVISILRLLNIDGGSQVELANHLVQIGTGEGKSVTLAVTATVLALLGYRVDCVCYSEYLSVRDHTGFRGLFQAFGLTPLIQYGTFKALCEDVINARGDVRSRVLDCITAQPSPGDTRKTHEAKGRVLLIDEVDVFFQADFYGNAYKPLAMLRDPVVADLVHYIWERRAARPTLEAIQQAAPYAAVCQRFGGWERLVEECVKGMLSDVQCFESPEYVVKNGRVGYDIDGGLSFTASFGYKTMFAHFKEHEARTVSLAARDASVGLLIACGNFSYAEVPKAYSYIMGATGTLETLSNCERGILDTVYNIHNVTYVPSVYGRNQLEFAPESQQYVIIEPACNHFTAIRREINRRFVGTHHLYRAVLVFFASKQQLKDFYHCEAMADLRDAVRTMTEETSPDEKGNLVRQAVSPGSITLLTREFGRGTDFKCFDDRLISAGGVHVIQTFVSDSLAEETQIKGRTARQGDIGSYSMVLKEVDLERYSITPEILLEMRANSKYYSIIHQYRQAFFEEQYPESIRYVSEIQADHLKSMGFVQRLLAADVAAVKDFLLHANRQPMPVSTKAPGVSRTLVLLDATNSMKDLLTKTKNTIRIMFDRVYWVLQHENKCSDFELQLAVYRNYNQRENMLLQHSTWERNPENLHSFLARIKATGGWGNEAVEVGLWHANEEHARHGIRQVIVIGDQPANSPDQVPVKRAALGEAYWQTTRFRTATTVWEQLEQLKRHRIPVHTFYIDDPKAATSAKGMFERVARDSGGQCMPLDIGSDAGAQTLTDLITERILDDLGGDQLVSAYRSEFCLRQVGYLR